MTHFNNHGRIAHSQTSVDDAWALCTSHPEIKADFENQAVLFNWVAKFECSPFWAYWFARNIVRDEWLAGEDLILTDKKIWMTYVAYTEGIRALGMIGWTLQENPEFVANEYEVIDRRRFDHAPSRRRRPERFDENAAMVADRIAAQMEEFKKQKKLQQQQTVTIDDDD